MGRNRRGRARRINGSRPYQCAAAGSPAAAIGSAAGKDAGTIRIKGGVITAKSGGGAGIGGGVKGSDGNLSITGGYIVAKGGMDAEEEGLFSADIGPGYGYTNSAYSVTATNEPSLAYVAPHDFRLACTTSGLGPKFYTVENLRVFCVAFTGLVANAAASISGVEFHVALPKR